MTLNRWIDQDIHRPHTYPHAPPHTPLNKALDGPGGVLQGLEARVLQAAWQVYKDEAPHSGRSELLYGMYVRLRVLRKPVCLSGDPLVVNEPH